MRSRLFLVVICVIACSIPCTHPTALAQTTWHVDDDAPNDPGPGDPGVSDPLEDGSAEHPFDAIGEGISASADGDTVLVADGEYTGAGNRDLNYSGKAITVRSENGPEACILDLDGEEGFTFNHAEGNDSILAGLTFRNGWSWSVAGGPGVRCMYASPAIIGNIIEDCEVDYGSGGAIYCEGGAPIIAANVIRHNFTYGDGGHGGGVYCRESAPKIINNLIYDNHAGGGYYGYTYGGGLYFLGCTAEVANNLIFDNGSCAGGGIYSLYGSLTVSNCTIADNHGGDGVCFYGEATFALTDCVIWGNTPGGISIGSGLKPAITFCDIQGGWEGEGNFDADPLFAGGPAGNYFLGHLAAGQPSDSPCIDAGSEAAEDACFTYGGQTYCAHRLSTRSDEYADTAQLDLGFHHPWRAIDAGVTCVPSWGKVPFTANIGVTLHNRFEVSRTIAGRVDAVLAGGKTYHGYRSGFAQIAPHQILEVHWPQLIPDLDMVDGANRLDLAAEDVTAAPFNQPPYPPSGDTGTGWCAIHGSRGKTFSVSIAATPVAGVLPDTSEICVGLVNATSYHRRLAFTVARTLAGGTHDPYYRNGFLNVAPFAGKAICWEESFPENASVTGINIYRVTAEDVTPAPYNLPPLPAAGDSETAECTFEGLSAQFQTWFVDDDAPSDPGPGDPEVSDPAENGSADHPFDALQEAIDAALERDLVQVADGVYSGAGNRDLSFRGKRLAVYSENGPATTIVDCQGSSSDRHRGVNFENGETNESILRGLTIKNGWHDEGAAVRCCRSSPVIIDCVVVDNTVGEDSYLGGAVLCQFSSPLIQHCVISRNTTADEHGYGIGVYCYSATLQITDSVVSRNTAPVGSTYGGGFFCTGSTLSASNCLIANNSVTSGGGGLYVSNSDTLLENCNIIGNSCGTSYGGGIRVSYSDSTTIRNCIIWNNIPNGIQVSSSPPPEVSYSDVQGGSAGEGNFDADPLFIDSPAGKFYLAQTAAGQLVDSPCLDAGSDLAGNICFPLVDGNVCLDELTTRTDLVPDNAQVDLGYHYNLSSSARSLRRSSPLP